MSRFAELIGRSMLATNLQRRKRGVVVVVVVVVVGKSGDVTSKTNVCFSMNFGAFG